MDFLSLYKATVTTNLQMKRYDRKKKQPTFKHPLLQALYMRAPEWEGNVTPVTFLWARVRKKVKVLVVDSDSFQSKDEINQASWCSKSGLFDCCLKRRGHVRHEEDNLVTSLCFNWRLVFTWCGESSPRFLTACVWAAQSHHPSPRCRPPFRWFPKIGPLLASLGRSALGISPAASLQSTGSPPRRISPSLIPPARRGEDGSGGKRVIM